MPRNDGKQALEKVIAKLKDVTERPNSDFELRTIRIQHYEDEQTKYTSAVSDDFDDKTPRLATALELAEKLLSDAVEVYHLSSMGHDYYKTGEDAFHQSEKGHYLFAQVSPHNPNKNVYAYRRGGYVHLGLPEILYDDFVVFTDKADAMLFKLNL